MRSGSSRRPCRRGCRAHDLTPRGSKHSASPAFGPACSCPFLKILGSLSSWTVSRLPSAAHQIGPHPWGRHGRRARGPRPLCWHDPCEPESSVIEMPTNPFLLGAAFAACSPGSPGLGGRRSSAGTASRTLGRVLPQLGPVEHVVGSGAGYHGAEVTRFHLCPGGRREPRGRRRRPCRRSHKTARRRRGAGRAGRVGHRHRSPA